MQSPHLVPPYMPPPAEAVRTIYQDAQIIVADKPSGLLSVPGRGPDKTTCANSVLSERHGEVLTVHRLDMDTSGLMVFARTREAHRALSRSFERRQTDKTYIARVQGVMSEDSGRIDLPIAKYSLQRPLRHIDVDGQEAITEWTVISRTPETTRLELRPKTGRSHQLRLHLSAIGHPILGDAFYGLDTSAPRLMLHASRLVFSHPETGRDMEFVAPPEF